MRVLDHRGPDPRSDRPATQLLHDDADARVVAFHVASGQAVAPHTSPSTVLVHVIEGEGIFRGAHEEARLGPGECAVYAPGELHSMHPAGQGSLRFLAIITPRPG